MNPNIGEISKEKSTGAKSDVGKFLQRAGKWKGGHPNTPSYRKAPQDLIELFEFFKGRGMEGVEQLKKLKELTIVLETLSLPKLLERLEKGEVPDKRELETIRLLKDTLVDSHKIEFGDKKIIEHKVTVDDIRRQMMSNKIVFDAKIIEEKLKS